MSRYSIDMSVAVDRQERIQAENTASFQLVTFQGGLNAEAVQASARLMLTTQSVMQDYQPLATRDSGKITEIAEHFSIQDQEQAASFN